MSFTVGREGVEPFTVRAYLKRSSGSSFMTPAQFSTEGRFNPTIGTFLLPPEEPPLAIGDLVAGYAITEELPAVGWLKYLGLRVLGASDFEGAPTFTVLERRTYQSEAGGVYEQWAETAVTVRALLREVEDEPAQEGGVERRHRVLELTLEGTLELDPTVHRLAWEGREYVVLEGHRYPSYAVARVKEVERGFVSDPNAQPAP